MTPDRLAEILEGALFAAGRPLSLEQLQGLFDEGEQPDTASLKTVLSQLQAAYQSRAVQLVQVASGWRFQVVPSVAPWVSRLWEERPPRYSRALMETLALIAYKQPVTRAEIEEIRGVAVSAPIIRTLQEREWIRVAGHKEVPGRPALFVTTKRFLDDFNVKNLADLPPLTDVRSLALLAPELEQTDE